MPIDEMKQANPVPIVIAGAPAPFRDALVAAASPGRFRIEVPDDLAAWASEDGSRVLVAMIGRTLDWTDAERYMSQPGVTTVVVTEDLAVKDFVRALVLGADGVVHADTTAHIIMAVVEAAARGEVVLPAEAARLMAKLANRRTADGSPLSPDELEVIRRLSRGVPLVQVAQELAWSERTLRRRLHNVCLKLGASNRAQAITTAAQLGLID